MIYAEVLDRFNKEGIEYVVVGMMSAIMQGMDITTMDLDVATQADKDSLKKTIGILNDLSFIPDASEINLDKETGVMKTGRPIVMFDPYSCVSVELLYEITGYTHEEIFAKSKVIEWEGLQVRALDIRDIAYSKEAANRPKDIAVMPRLKEVIAELDKLEQNEPKGRIR